jgi:very-short-patch-repair endonuclease
VDFVCFETRLIIEADGGQHQGQAAYDGARTRYLRACGYRVLRFWNNEVLLLPEAVLEKVLETLATPHPNSLPQGERE